MIGIYSTCLDQIYNGICVSWETSIICILVQGLIASFIFAVIIFFIIWWQSKK